MSDLTNKIVKGPGTLASAAYERLRRDLMTAQLMPGQKLNIRHLCLRYEMGLSPVREALNRLLRDGLVTQADQQGFGVAPVGIEQLDELARTRCWLNELGLRESIAYGDMAWEEGVVFQACHRLLRLPATKLMATRRCVILGGKKRIVRPRKLTFCLPLELADCFRSAFDAAERYRHISRIASQPDRRDEHKQIMGTTVARDADLAVSVDGASAELRSAHVPN